MQRLSVAPDRRVRGVERMGNLSPDMSGELLRQHGIAPPRQLEDGPQRGPVDEFEDEDGPVLLGLQVVERRHDPRMVEQADHPRLVGQHAGDPLVTSPFGRQDLQHHPAAKCACALQFSEPHFTHAPEPQPLLENVPPADDLARLQLTDPPAYLL